MNFHVFRVKPDKNTFVFHETGKIRLNPRKKKLPEVITEMKEISFVTKNSNAPIIMKYNGD